MRCFEEHQVIVLEANTESVTIHKPLYCSVHATEILKYFCYSCETPVCNECLIVDHKATEHRYEIISEAEKLMRMEVEKVLAETRSKVEYCNDESNKLEMSLHELQLQKDAAQSTIRESYEIIMRAIEKRRDQALADLKSLHSERDIKIMEQIHQVEKSVDQIKYCAGFTRKLLDNGNGPEILSMKKMISHQLAALINTIPKVDVNYSLEFVSNADKFDDYASELFGKFRTESSVSPKECTPPPTLPGMPPMLCSTKNNMSQNGNGSSITTTGSVSNTASSPISLPSMQSSFDGDISSFGKHYGIMKPKPPIIVPSELNVPPVTNIVEYNLHRLASMAESTPTPDLTDSILPASTPSDSNYLFGDEMLTSDQQMFNNIQALAKLNGTMDQLSLMDSFNSHSSTSPILQTPSVIPGMNDDVKMSCYSHFRTPGAGIDASSGRAKATPMQIRVKFGALGPARGQFNSPHGFCLGLDEEIIVADTNNHRIEVFEKNGSFKFHFGVPGKEEGQLWFPRKVAVMRTNSKFVVCDRGNERSRMQIFTKNGHYIKKIAIRYIDIVAGLAVTNQGHIVAVDSVSPTVFIISEDGDLVHWFDCSDHMREPSDIAISGKLKIT